RLPAAGLADDAQRFAGPDIEGDLLHRVNAGFGGTQQRSPATEYAGHRIDLHEGSVHAVTPGPPRSTSRSPASGNRQRAALPAPRSNSGMSPARHTGCT